MKLDLPTIDPREETDLCGERPSNVRGVHARRSEAVREVESPRGKHAAWTSVSAAAPAHARASSASASVVAPPALPASATSSIRDASASATPGKSVSASDSAVSEAAGGASASAAASVAEKGRHVASYAALAESELEALRRRSRRMKWAAAIACVVVLAGAGVAAAFALGGGERQRSEAPAVLPVDESPATVKATVKADGVVIDGPTLSRGVRLSRVESASDLGGSYEDSHYRAVYEGKVVYVEKKWIRTASESAPEEWTGYAAADAIVCARHDLSGEDVLTLGLNEEVTVLDEFNGLLYVRNADGYEGYVPADKILREKAEESAATDPADHPDYYYHGSSGGSSGGSNASSGSGGSGGSAGSSGGSTSSGGSNSSGGSGSSGGGSSSGSSGSGGGSGGSGSGAGGSDGSSGSGGTSEPGDGDEMLLPVGMTLPVDRFLLGVGVAYADEIDRAAEGSDGKVGIATEAANAASTGHSTASEADEGLTAVVLADEIPTCIAILNRGDEVSVKKDDLFGFDSSGATAGSAQLESSDVEEEPLRTEGDDVADAEAGEDFCTIVVNGQEATLPEKLLRLEGEAAYDPWMGCALEGAALYVDYLLSVQGSALLPGDEVSVIDAIGSTLVVEWEGKAFYLDEALVSREPADAEDDEVDDASTGGSEGAAASSTGGGSVSSSYGNGASSGGSSSTGSAGGETSAAGGSSSGASSGGSSSSGSAGGSASGNSGSIGGGSSSGSSGGGTAGGTTGGADSGNSSDPEDEWTPPKL